MRTDRITTPLAWCGMEDSSRLLCHLLFAKSDSLPRHARDKHKEERETVILLTQRTAVSNVRVAQAAAVTHILSSLGLVNPPQGISGSNGGSGSHSRFLEALEDNAITPPKMLGVLSDAYSTRKAQSEAAAKAAKARGELLPLPPTIPMALRVAVPLPFGDGKGAVAATAKGLWRPRSHCGDIVAPGRDY